MGAPDDPKKPRENPRLREFEKLIDKNWQAFQQAQNHHQRYAYAMILKAHLESWLNEREVIVDLAQGASPAAGGWSRPADGLSSGQSPFDRFRDTGTDSFFYCSAYGRTTRLFSRAELDADPLRSLRAPGFVVTLYRKIYATRAATCNHFTSDEAFERHVRPPTIRIWSAKGDYHVLMDPKGFPDSRMSKGAFATKNKGTAIEKAEEIAGTFGIRCVVAEVIRTEDTH